MLSWQSVERVARKSAVNLPRWEAAGFQSVPPCAAQLISGVYAVATTSLVPSLPVVSQAKTNEREVALTSDQESGPKAARACLPTSTVAGAPRPSAKRPTSRRHSVAPCWSHANVRNPPLGEEVWLSFQQIVSNGAYKDDQATHKANLVRGQSPATRHPLGT